MQTLTRGQVAKMAGVNIETLRYYERRTLIPSPERSESGYRQYAPETVSRVKFIKRAQELGFSLREIADLLSLRVDDRNPCSKVRMRTVAKIIEIEQKIESLQAVRAALIKLAEACKKKEPTGQCPILELLSGEE